MYHGEIDTAAFLLESALKVASKDYQPLIAAIYFLESAIYLESVSNSTRGLSAGLLKNAGLAHVNLIQNKLVPSNGNNGYPLPYGKDILFTSDKINWPFNRFDFFFRCYQHEVATEKHGQQKGSCNCGANS